jgi:hypothetical protein
MFKKSENSPDDGQAKAKGRSASSGPSFVRFMRLGECLALSQNCEKRLLVSSCLSLRPFARMEQLGSHWTDFHEILYLSIFRKSVEEIQVPLKSDKNNGCTLREDLCTFMIISRWIFPRMKNVSDKVLEKIKTHILCSVVYEIKATDDKIIWSMRIACWITKATDTHSEYVMLIYFPRQQWSHERASMLRLYVHCLSCWNFHTSVIAIWIGRRIFLSHKPV